jgi:hypothetical protein
MSAVAVQRRRHLRFAMGVVVGGEVGKSRQKTKEQNLVKGYELYY